MKEYMCFGVIGNFANHLEQAGENVDFIHIKGDESGEPKGIFPFYVPRHTKYLSRFCINNKCIIMPKDTTFNVQAEPEVALECEVMYDDGHLVKELKPKFFMAFNDASVRNDASAKKMSQRKNFSFASKGAGNKISIDSFETGGICDSYSLTSFLICDDKIHQYGDDVKLINYNFFYQKLIKWLIKKFNTQEDIAVLEDIKALIKEANYPKTFLVSVGGTSYTPFAEKRLLKSGDEICIVAYNHNIYDNEKIKGFLMQGVTGLKDASVLRQVIE